MPLISRWNSRSMKLYGASANAVGINSQDYLHLYNMRMEAILLLLLLFPW